MVRNVENVSIFREADSSYNHGIGMEGLEPGTFLLIRYEARAITTAAGYTGLRFSFYGGEVDMVGKRVANL
jgi:hypothetical protein